MTAGRATRLEGRVTRSKSRATPSKGSLGRDEAGEFVSQGAHDVAQQH